MIKKIFNRCNLYFAIFVIYEMHGFLFPKTSLINRVLVFLIIGIGIAHFYKIITHLNDSKLVPFLGVLNVFTVVLSLYGLVNIFIGGVSSYVSSEVFLKNILMSFLPLYSFYYYSQKGYITSTWIKYVLFILCAVSVVQYNQYRVEELADAAIGRENITNNAGYAFLALMPFLFFWNNKRIIQFLLLFFISVYIISGMKRGAIFIGFICTLYFFIQTFKNTSSSRNILVMLLVFIFGFVVYNIWSDFSTSNTYFQHRLEATISGDSNGRDMIYSTFLDHFMKDANVFNILFGFGADATIAYNGYYAHQDWIELLLDCGVFGVVVYFCFYFSGFKSRCKFGDNSIYCCLVMSFLILFGKSLFSMGYQSIGLYQGLSIGYCLSAIKEYKSHIIYG